MSYVRFAMLCDKCGARSAEYSRWNQCKGCEEDACDKCSADNDDESASCMCNKCLFVKLDAIASAKRLVEESPRHDSETLWRALDKLYPMAGDYILDVAVREGLRT